MMKPCSGCGNCQKCKDFKFINNGLFGYINYDAVQYFEDVSISKKEEDVDIPDIFYAVYQNIIAINHFKNVAYVFLLTVMKMKAI